MKKLNNFNPHKSIHTSMLGLSLLFVGLIALMCFKSAPQPDPLLGDIHYHADFKVYLNGIAYDFAQEQYMTEAGGISFNPFVHLHDMNGNVIHKHFEGITLGDFFTSLGMGFNQNCFSTDYKTEFCNDESHTLKFYVNGELNTKFDQYEIQDLDKILISYGDETEVELQTQLNSITNEACIYSETCPEQGSPPDESSCLGSEECLAPQTNEENI